ncbi:MAG: hypothetical protein EOP63_13630 [Sphingomonadales bacterium]|nr:MAG: hypothetical protein EOP63_13630 [Sphingomonadales bacterium]
MFRLTITGLALIGAASTARAEPIGRWWSGFGQGTLEYAIKNDSAGSDYFCIACPIGEGARMIVGGVDPKLLRALAAHLLCGDARYRPIGPAAEPK